MKLWACVVCNVILICYVAGCNRRPQGASGDRSPVDENFQILLEGNPSTYIPGQRYNVSLSCADALKFISFTLVVESESDASRGYDILGHFELVDTAETKFSSLCANMIESANTNAKTRVHVVWVAPSNPESGCVLLKAALLQHRNVWFIDDGFLTKRICAEEIDDVNSQTPPVDPCCACDEAKYELVVERKWSRNTHAKDFPVEAWRTRLSELIGASHAQGYRFWQYGSRASRGLQEMAEHSSTQTLEAEIKTGKIRTIIKAPGIMYRSNNVLGSTLANVRVDAEHHQISLVSKVEPSPDWILGVAGLELCLANCTWISEKVLNLYPWDIGTDAGPSYMSPDQPQVPPDVIRRMTSSFPSDHRSPFYEESGAPMKPLATLFIRRKKLYERECDTGENMPLECVTHPWNSWSECSSKCGPGSQYRTRSFKDPALAESFNCQVVLSQVQKCIGNQCGSPDSELSKSEIAACELTTWDAWSECSKRCGKGYSTRVRNYLNAHEKDKCQRTASVELEQIRECEGEDCGGAIPTGGYENDELDQHLENNKELNLLEDNFLESSRYSQKFKPNRWSGGKEVYTRYDSQGIQPKGPPQSGPNPTSEFYDKQIPEIDSSNADQFEDTIERNDLRQTGYGTRDNRFLGKANMQEYDDANNQRVSQPPSSGHYFTLDQTPLRQSHNRNRHTSHFANAPDLNVLYNQPTEDVHKQQEKPFGIREEYDQNGHKTIMVEGMNPNDYIVMQQYCFEKPYPTKTRCHKPKVIIRNYWFYDAEDRECKLFSADNCDENKNKFRTLDACEGTCHRPQRNLEDMQKDNPRLKQFEQSRSLTKPQQRRHRYKEKVQI